MKTHNAKHTLTPLVLSAAVAASSAVMADTPYTKPDGSFVSIGGTVTSPTADTFVLDYGDGTILVEMDDWDRYGDAYGLLDGDRVTVYGRIDDDFFEMAKIEAGSVYVENLNTFFYADSDDEEGSVMPSASWTTAAPVVVSGFTLRGEVTEVDTEDQEFVVQTGTDEITVQTDQLGYNPTDNHGFQRVDEGDWVSVSGSIDYQLFDGQVLSASRITTLIDNAPAENS
ncbi:OB-fold nucleic acid binding domain protein [Luminiphilus syltensis NOR5-1B]|uniref:OB-fold nucleic acid binding domain protein n=1 Tax=Luminiphilus syltensis NOR5-1B TaxID=565045 RepID=B8KTW1_9GAMM|nr:hypothetical protein [Luminiphilus syltensis]EED36177.1 OB-fold nucleic acid binding domain protein [Luminiphilus syltensis NOR5-1B]